MLFYLLQNYPLLGHYVIEKMSFASLKRLRPICAYIDHFLSKKNIKPKYRMCFHEDISKNEICLINTSENSLPTTHNRDIYGTSVRNIEIEGLYPESHDEQDKPIQSFKDRISCYNLFVKDSTERSILHYTAAFQPSRLLEVYRLEHISTDFLADPTLKCVEAVSLALLPCRINLNKRVDSMKNLAIYNSCTGAYNDDIFIFLENWLSGRQTLRRLYIDHGVNSSSISTETILEKFEEFSTLNPNGTIRMHSTTESAFISNSERSFFFQSVENDEEERLEPFFDKGVCSFWNPHDGDVADFDNELNDSTGTYNNSFNDSEVSNEASFYEADSGISRISDGFGDISFTEIHSIPS